MRGLAIGARVAALALLAALGLNSCAYYNTYYLAKKNYDKATLGLPYRTGRPEGGNTQQFNKSIELSKKLMAQYPKDKLVDDAYLLWARALLGIDDPRLTLSLLEDFETRFPQSSLKADARFYLGVAYRQTRKYGQAIRVFDEFLAASPKHDMVPFAQLEKARALIALDRDEEAAAAVGATIQSYPKFVWIDQARLVRAEALLAQGAHDEARLAFQDLGRRATSNVERLDFLLREADCLEAARHYDDELSLLKGAIAHERQPAPPDSAELRQGLAPQTQGLEAYGRLMIRIGTAHLLSERRDEALAAYQRVAEDYRRTPLGAEAQYRIGYAYETVADDFDKARAEYAKVRDHGGGSAFLDQAGSRLASLERLAQFKSTTGDSVEAKAEAAFMLAELYLFQLDKPERALEQYRKIEGDFKGSAMAGKALNAQGWVLSRKLDRADGADSLFWAVVHEYPKTEAQIAARDYLEFAGVFVPEDLIQFPEPLYAALDSTAAPDSASASEPALASEPAPPPLLTSPRSNEPSPGAPLAGAPLPDLGPPIPTDSLLRAASTPVIPTTPSAFRPLTPAPTALRTQGPPPQGAPTPAAVQAAAPPTPAAIRSAPVDTTKAATPRPVPPPAPAPAPAPAPTDTTKAPAPAPAPPDTSRAPE